MQPILRQHNRLELICLIESALSRWIVAIRQSDRVNNSVKKKTDAELLIHYELTDAEKLTNLGILLIGTKRDRSTLGTAPVIQAIRYNEQGRSISWLPRFCERWG
jgi:ATP-dependent DNA helicase RecG